MTKPSSVAAAVPARMPSSVGSPQERSASPVTYAAEPRNAAWPNDSRPT